MQGDFGHFCHATVHARSDASPLLSLPICSAILRIDWAPMGHWMACWGYGNEPSFLQHAHTQEKVFFKL